MSLRKRTQFVLGLSCKKDGDPHSEAFELLRSPSKTKHYTSLLKKKCVYL